MRQSELDFTNNLRQASPYIAKHRGKTIVIYLPGDVIANPDVLHQLSKDLVLLNNLGLKIVLALGATQQINQALQRQNLHWETHNGHRITEQKHLQSFQETIGFVRAQIEAAFTQATAEQHSQLAIASGNWVTAQPKGIIDGVDFQHTGVLRKINQSAIEQTLASGQIALITPLAYSLTGEAFNLNTLDQAFALAKALEAEKLMLFHPQAVLEKLPQAMSAQNLTEQIEHCQNTELKRILSLALTTGNQLKRIHLMNQSTPDALLLELFSRDGLGSMIFMDRYHQTRPAQIDDVAGIINLIAPLESEGILVKRSRETLEQEIGNFVIAEIDEQIIGCAALYPITEHSAELACLAVDPSYRGKSLGTELLSAIEVKASESNLSELFLLTTHTQHWFIEHGFAESRPDALPKTRQALYNYQRQSKVLKKTLQK